MKKRISAICAALCTVFLSASTFAQTLYAPDGRTAEVEQNDVQSWQDVGWYTYPVMNVYAPDGRVVLIAQSDLQDWQNVGWYSYPVMNVYAPDGRVVTIAKTDWDSWSKVGWYSTAAEAQSKNTSYSGGSSKSSYSAPSYSASSGATVYVGETGNKYHKKNCKTLKNGSYPISYEEAIREGRTACKVCGG